MLTTPKTAGRDLVDSIGLEACAGSPDWWDRAGHLARGRNSSAGLHDMDGTQAAPVRADLAGTFASIAIEVGAPDPGGFDVVVNCTPLGMATRLVFRSTRAGLAPGMLV